MAVPVAPFTLAAPNRYARVAGLLYLIIIVLGLFSEVGVRSSLILPTDAAATARHIAGAADLFRMGFFADSLMALSDIALAVVLFALLKPVHPVLALLAMVFRLAQAGVIALNLLSYYAALLLLEGAVYGTAFEEQQRQGLALFFLDLHSHGYDLGLILFGAHCLILGVLIARSRYLPAVLGYLVMAAGLTYLVGSYTRFLHPGWVDTIAPIYLIALVSELSLCLWLLIKGINLEQWQAVTEAASEGVEA